MSNSSVVRHFADRNITALHPPMLSSVREAAAQLAAAKAAKSDEDIQVAQTVVQDAVDAARNADVTWGAIGDALGLSRGNAYQRYRLKPNRLS